MRIIIHPACGIGNFDKIKLRFDMGLQGTTRKPQMQTHCLGNLLTNRQNGIERCHRLLKDHRHFTPAQMPHVVKGQLG